MGKTNIKTSSKSIIGDRPSQQDAMCQFWSEDTFVSVVCDGMGGMAGGELASKTAVSVISKELSQIGKEREEMIAQKLVDAFREADQKVAELTDKHGKKLKGGTTVVAAVVRDNHFYWGSVGDSAIYFLDRDGTRLQNRMHNYNLRIDELLRKGEMAPETAQRERMMGDALISYIGMNGIEVLDATVHPKVLQAGDMVLLSSDGLYKSLTPEQIRAIIEESGGSMELAVERLCTEAHRLTRVKLDNTTVSLIRFSPSDLH